MSDTKAVDVDCVLKGASITAGYGDISVIKDLDIEVRAGEVVAMLGANGAGKTTTLLALAGALPLKSGSVLVEGVRVGSGLHRMARRGVGFVSEERSVFMALSVSDNIRLGRVEQKDVYAMFPILEERAHTKAGLLSGGEQQMLTLARALLRQPMVLLADELSLGLAPLIVAQLLQTVREAADRGMGVLLVEQHVRQALQYADRVYVMRRGEIVFRGTAQECENNIEEIEVSYLGGTDSVY